MGNRYVDFLQNSGLYESISVNQDGIGELITLIRGDCRIDQYCPSCHAQRVFRMLPIRSLHGEEDNSGQRTLLADILLNYQNRYHAAKIPLPGIRPESTEKWSWDKGLYSDTHVIVFQFRCSMCDAHTLDYAVLNNHDSLIKIGQYPSLADISINELQEYRKDIDNESFKELRRAAGLHAQGIGVGSYVYLRRVFERVLIKASKDAISEGSINSEEFKIKRVDEKIKMLKDNLPTALSDNAALYGIVSKGIHELSESDCIKYFPILNACILLILRQWKKQREDRENERQISAAISEIASQLK